MMSHTWTHSTLQNAVLTVNAPAVALSAKTAAGSQRYEEAGR